MVPFEDSFLAGRWIVTSHSDAGVEVGISLSGERFFTVDADTQALDAYVCARSAAIEGDKCGLVEQVTVAVELGHLEHDKAVGITDFTQMMTDIE